MLEELIRSWDGEAVVTRYDRPTGTWIFLCIHSTTRGPAGGGTRMNVYPTPGAALQDAMRLSEGMTLKMAGVDVAFGGGKAVLAVPELLSGDDRRGLLLRYGRLVNSLGGSYQTGPDMNTTIEDMDVIAEQTPYVFCRSVDNGGCGDPGPYTARGVYHGIRASLRHVFGTDELTGRSVLVQGVGAVGQRLAEQLADAGARVLVTDIDGARAAAVAKRVGGEAIPLEGALSAECDVYAPCAVGATLNAESIPRLRCRIVAGCANNQLRELADAERLRHAGILYAPDFVINAGGAMHGIGLEQLGWDDAELDRRVEGIGATLTRIFEASEAERITTDEAAERLAAERLRDAS